MPVHDWTRVTAGIFHHFHQQWVIALSNSLNDGRLPVGYYALAEQSTADMAPDVLALQFNSETDDGNFSEPEENTGGTALAAVLPKVRFTAELVMDYYALKQDTLMIHHSGGDRVIAMIEIVSAGNKSSRHGIRAFVEKAATALYRGHHLLVLDLHPPGPRDPQGIHGEIRQEIGDDTFRLPADEPLTLASYSSGLIKRAYIEPIAVGDTLPEMPLFLRPEVYINVPLEQTYEVAWRNVLQRWRTVLESAPRG